MDSKIKAFIIFLGLSIILDLLSFLNGYYLGVSLLFVLFYLIYGVSLYLVLNKRPWGWFLSAIPWAYYLFNPAYNPSSGCMYGQLFNLFCLFDVSFFIGLLFVLISFMVIAFFIYSGFTQGKKGYVFSLVFVIVIALTKLNILNSLLGGFRTSIFRYILAIIAIGGFILWERDDKKNSKVVKRK